MNSQNVLTLRKPVTVFGDARNTLEFREPTAAEVIEHGSPQTAVVLPGNRVGIETNYAVVAAYAALLSGTTPGTIASLHRLDLLQAGRIISGFFNDGESQEQPGSPAQ